MPSAERTFAVPCPCSAVVSVTAGQAGTRATCPACGGFVDVPRLRDLAMAPSASVEDAAVRRPAWDAARGITFAGAAVALLAAPVAALVVPLGGLLVAQPPSPDEVRRSVDRLPITMVRSAVAELAQSGLNRPKSPAEVRFARFTSAARGMSRVLWGVAAVAAVTAAVGFVVRASPDHPGDDAR